MTTSSRRVAVIGDIHGCVDEFNEMLTALDLRPGIDIFVSAGDIVDKGPNSEGALRAVREALARYPGSGAVMGNHEAKWLRKRTQPDADPIPGGHEEWLRSLPLYLKFPAENLMVTHGGPFPHLYETIGSLKDGDDQWFPHGKRGKTCEKLMYTRFVKADGSFSTVDVDESVDGLKHWTEVYDGRDGFVIGGHQPTRTVLEGAHGACIDTGCVFGGYLTAMVVEGSKRSLVQVKARRPYSSKVIWHQDQVKG